MWGALTPGCARLPTLPPSLEGHLACTHSQAQTHVLTHTHTPGPNALAAASCPGRADPGSFSQHCHVPRSGLCLVGTQAQWLPEAGLQAGWRASCLTQHRLRRLSPRTLGAGGLRGPW